MIHVIASIKIKEEYLSSFIEIFKANVQNVLKETGCLGYEPCRDIPTGLPIQETDASAVTIVERWESMEDLTAHLSAPHMVDYKEKTKDMVENLSVKILEQV